MSGYYQHRLDQDAGIAPATEATLRRGVVFGGERRLDVKAKNDQEFLSGVRATLLAVRASEFAGIKCDDVDGQNWFDRRERILDDMKQLLEGLDDARQEAVRTDSEYAGMGHGQGDTCDGIGDRRDRHNSGETPVLQE
jgi:hypothetical protein